MKIDINKQKNDRKIYKCVETKHCDSERPMSQRRNKGKSKISWNKQQTKYKHTKTYEKQQKQFWEQSNMLN